MRAHSRVRRDRRHVAAGIRERRVANRPNGDRLIWLDRLVLAKLNTLRGPSESYSDVLLALAAAGERFREAKVLAPPTILRIDPLVTPIAISARPSPRGRATFGPRVDHQPYASPGDRSNGREGWVCSRGIVIVIVCRNVGKLVRGG
jgi:hypothetical protein